MTCDSPMINFSVFHLTLIVIFKTFQYNTSLINYNLAYRSFQVCIYFLASLIICNYDIMCEQITFTHNIYFNFYKHCILT